ncbi:translocation/assembly module TamB domain-containing protein [Azospirillum agricola]|uniref:translocation/assembly module TamB domain-containing protein n=1 Tax=Azospirillum agricola TaxID=1720247 RepID=UPI000A0F1B46|nr:translocation/assembly module TamB domain-containing protein [Azospirillum agricola]SMH58818.1 autotransporter secretion inner membrane protein TamB [Azospirillum lipoferum]
MVKALRVLLVGLAVLVLLVVVAVGAGALWLQSESGRRWLTATVENAVASPDQRLTLGAIEGRLPFDFTIASVAMADTQGTWLTLERVHVALSPSALLARTVRIETLEAARIAVERAPVTTQPAPPPPTDQPTASLLPELPVGIRLDRLAVDELRLGEALLGEAATLRLDGSAALDAGGSALDGRLSVARIDDKPGQADVTVAFAPSRKILTLAAKASEPQGGVIARTLAIPGLPPVALSLDGDGSLDDWKGKLTARADNAVDLTADAAIRATPEGHAVTLAAGGDVAVLAGPAAAPLVGPQPALNVSLLVAPDGALTIRPLTITAAAGQASLEGTVSPDRKRLGLRWSVTAGPDSALHALVPAVSWRDGMVTGSAEGPLDALVVALTARLREVTTGDPTVTRLAGPEIVLDGRARIDTGRGSVGLEALTLTAAAAKAAIQGGVDGWGQVADLTLSLAADDLEPLSALAGRPLGGAVNLAGPLRRKADGSLSAELSGRLDRLTTGTPADAVLGDAAALKAALAMEPDGAMRLNELALDGRNGRLTGSAALVAGVVDAKTRLELNALAPVGEAVGTPMAGSLTLDATARGPMDKLEAQATLRARDLVVQERRLGATEIEARAVGLPASPNGTLAVRTHLDGTPLTLDGAYAMQGQTLRLSNLTVATGGNRIGGELVVALETLLATGRLEGNLPNLKSFSELAGVPLDGGAGFTLALDGKGGKQAATLSANASNLRVEGEGGPLLAARRLTATAEVADVLGTPSGKARLELNDGAAAGNDLASVTASVDGSLARAAFQAAATGAGADPIGLDLGGNLTREGAMTRIRLERLQGRYAGESIRMTGPATVTLAEQRYEVAGLNLMAGGARLAADLGLNGERLNGEIRLEQLPLALARLADPGLKLDGTANAQATLGGTLRNPRADATLRVAGARAQQTTQAGVPGIDATVTAQWRDRRLSVNADAGTKNNAGRLTASAAVPLVMNPDSYAVSLPPKGALEAAVNGTLDASLLNDLLAASGDRARGSVRLDVRASGTVEAPRLGGSVVLSGGRYENRASGAVISDIEARLVGDGDVFTIQSFQARTRNGGAIGARGVIRPAAPAARQLDLVIQADNARLVENDLATAEANANLTVTGGFANARLAGPIRVRRVEIQIPDRLPTTVVDLKVKEVGRGKRQAAGTTNGRPPPRKPGAAAAPAPTPAEAAAPPFVLALDLTVEAQNQVFVRGRGLDAELGGQLKVGGTAAAPEVTGRFGMQKGQLDLLAQNFTFKRGNFDFDGTQPIDPRLDLLAEATANGVTAQVVVSGTARQPKIELTSPQGLPQDEVLSAVLFGKSVANLGAAEAVQLAQSAAALSGVGGSGGGLLDRVRRGLGVDRLDFSQGSDGKGGAVQAGRYVSDRVYVGVEQGIGANQTRAKVEFDITKSLKAQADVGANSETRFGLTFERDY